MSLEPVRAQRTLAPGEAWTWELGPFDQLTAHLIGASTCNFFQSVDGKTWVPILGLRRSDGTVATSSPGGESREFSIYSVYWRIVNAGGAPVQINAAKYAARHNDVRRVTGVLSVVGNYVFVEASAFQSAAVVLSGTGLARFEQSVDTVNWLPLWGTDSETGATVDRGSAGLTAIERRVPFMRVVLDQPGTLNVGVALRQLQPDLGNPLLSQLLYISASDRAYTDAALAALAETIPPPVNLGAYATHSELTTAVSAAVTGLVTDAPGLLNTLGELSDALGDDPNFAATLSSSLATINTTLANKVDFQSLGEATLASAATVDLGATTASRVIITGTTAITSFGSGVNKLRFVRFASAGVVLTQGANLQLPSGANITTQANDMALLSSDGSAIWRVRHYQRADGTPLVTPATTVADNAVTMAKLADIATATIIGRNAAGTGDPAALTPEQVAVLLEGARGTLFAGGNTGSSFASNNGYLKLPNGFMVQWGTYTGGDTTITLPQAYVTGFLVFCTASYAAASSENAGATATPVTLSTFSLRPRFEASSGLTTASTGVAISWFTVGK